jgi:hypothetical protein
VEVLDRGDQFPRAALKSLTIPSDIVRLLRRPDQTVVRKAQY